MSAVEIPKVETNGFPKEPIAPEPTAQFYDTLTGHYAFQSNIPLPTPQPVPMPVPWPLRFGARVKIWKQDPSVAQLGRKLKYIPGMVFNGPRNVRIKTELPGVTPVSSNVVGDFLFAGNTPESDCAHTFAVVWLTYNMYKHANDGAELPWAWNMENNTDPLKVYPRAGVAPNAYYSRYEKALKFFYFTPAGATSPIFTCRSLDIVAHETGHAILDGLKPNWLRTSNPPQTGALHESFGDLTALFLTLSELDLVEAFISMTKANLHAKNFLAALAEEFGSALGRPMGLRNADNNLKLSNVSNQVHELSQVFTGAIYDILADIFTFEYRRSEKLGKDPAHILLNVSQNLLKVLFKAIKQAPETSATYIDVVNKMLQVSQAMGEPPIYRSFIRNRFAFREIIVSPTPLTMISQGKFEYDDEKFVDGGEDITELKAFDKYHASLIASQDRSGCCGTMQLPEYDMETKRYEKEKENYADEKAGILIEDILLVDEIKNLKKAFK